MSELSDLPSLTATLAAYSLRADKRLGQHFLLDANITDRIARLTGDISDVHVMEIGPGPGGLTRSILMCGARKVTAVEMDNRFLPLLQDVQRVSGDRLSVIEADGLKVDPATLGVTRIAANLPYNVGTKMLTNWLTAQPPFWDRLVLMFQKEVAERVVARPGDNAYGRLAILTAAVASSHIAMTVPAHCFSPPPKVDSAVVVLDILPQGERFADLKTLGQITAGAFNQRRKMLRQSLKSIAKKHDLILQDWLTGAGIDPTQRAETVTPAQFQALASNIK
ncbi:16S rRNA (adenine(1518)-N(6)/adenine(1519)-N(6))-dimethyltransferase RsmA [Robiginitomaculum antarcticum]|uniref:16S rRNA (adenine(1518)-N(6)/adenine(1519)-N(6))- dimethyltransferase RsmA n=1 Tax=Robiginitomaculum antarcticum TaxID=437507 RepID=UPI00036F0CBA|nr:16S rRNA (adenine(1518)-N(6)/adenine(1519)-N(6))-dimethyltransferase RsmA [Robiginitomaculum antarcticum]